MIIDSHVHLHPTEEVGKMVVEMIKEQYGVGYYSYGTPDDYLKDMQRSGIDKAVMVSFAPDNQLKNNNFWTVAITRPGKNRPAKYPMFIPFISVSPTMKGRTPIEELEHKYKWGMKGLKIHPVAQGFDVGDERMWPVYEWLVKHNLPITAHSGINIDNKSSFGEPKRWMPVLEEFESLKLILAHLGNGFWDQTLEIADKFSNVRFDTAIAISHINTPTTLDDEDAVDLIKAIGAEKILFGSDYPWINPSGDIKRIKALEISENDKELILGKNAAKLFK
ncbi:amidohydrolase family protein [Methanobacterium alcaliphilum]|uniref:amidohydrolase family protein n=1 Tax=Methanobacterium alcaliphilum TaxID=392018 RepID=UPI00200B25F2|nr:amidohydrolase family protein [Methanobacterium alcaliphilum]MCK9150538.1 amidohydrolase family protein [Methanobacterium alcaliphilum]